MKRFAILAVIILAIIAGCVSQENAENPASKPSETVKTTPTPTPEKVAAEKPVVYYFYHPRCPNCQAVEPLINYLVNSSNIEFDICNVQFFSNCTNESRALALAVKDKTGFFGTPTAVVKVGQNYTVFIGKFEVMEMVKFLGNYSELPEVKLNESTYSIKECLDCHEERGLDPPSTYTCSYCCHSI